MSKAQNPTGLDPLQLWEQYGHLSEEEAAEAVKKLPLDVLRRYADVEGRGDLFPDDLPMDVVLERERCLNSPSYLATEILDPFYKKHFEKVHYQLMDDCIAPYMLGEPTTIEGQTYDPKQYLGLLILFPRGTFKSSIIGMIVLWIHLYRKLRLTEDARTMYVHQVLKKAVGRGEVIRGWARYNKKFRATFPEFQGKPGEWDTQEAWRWPHYKTTGATEFSFQAYGESSDKTGGHYTEEFIDDYETQWSVTTAGMIETSWSRFQMMENLRDLSRPFNPRVVCGTTYHHQGIHKRLERDGGYLVWSYPAHRGSPKTLFDLCDLDPRVESQMKRIQAGIKKLDKERPRDLNFPNLYPWSVLYQKARASRLHYGGQQLLDPTPEGEQRFDPHAVDQSWVQGIPNPSEMWLYVRCDPAISRKRENDECTIGVGGVDWRGWRYSLDGWGGREKRPTEIVRKIFAFARKWQARGYLVQNIGVESVQYQEALAQLCRDGVPEREATFHGEQVNILKSPCAVRSITRSSDMNKQTRILEIEGPVSRRELKIWTRNPVAQRQAQQLKNFPHDKDDWLDVLHDFWGQGVLIPGRSLPAPVPKIHRVFDQFMKPEQKPAGTAGNVHLFSWGRRVVR